MQFIQAQSVSDVAVSGLRSRQDAVSNSDMKSGKGGHEGAFAGLVEALSQQAASKNESAELHVSQEGENCPKTDHCDTDVIKVIKTGLEERASGDRVDLDGDSHPQPVAGQKIDALDPSEAEPESSHTLSVPIISSESSSDPQALSPVGGKDGAWGFGDGVQQGEDAGRWSDADKQTFLPVSRLVEARMEEQHRVSETSSPVVSPNHAPAVSPAEGLAAFVRQVDMESRAYQNHAQHLHGAVGDGGREPPDAKLSGIEELRIRGQELSAPDVSVKAGSPVDAKKGDTENFAARSIVGILHEEGSRVGETRQELGVGLRPALPLSSGDPNNTRNVAVVPSVNQTSFVGQMQLETMFSTEPKKESFVLFDDLPPLTVMQAGQSAMNQHQYGRTVVDMPRQISAQIVEAMRSGVERPVELQLHPEELGRVRLTFQTDASSLNVVLQMERPETLELMRRHIELLAQDMRDIGYEDVSFSFSQGEETPEDGTQDGKQSPDTARTKNDTGSAVEAKVLQISVGETDRMDIRV